MPHGVDLVLEESLESIVLDESTLLLSTGRKCVHVCVITYTKYLI